MNRHAMTKPHMPHFKRAAMALALPAALMLSACGSSPAEQQAAEPPLAGAEIGGPFTLVDSEGKEVQWSDFDGKYRIVYFGYTYCPDICPFDVQKIMRGYEQFKESEPDLAAQIQPLFISIDPERDTPAKVGEFTHAFSDDLLGLTGTPEQVAAAAEAFKVYYEKGEIVNDGQYLMNHSAAAYLMGRDGEPVALLAIDEGPDAVAADLEKWVS